MRIVLWGAGPDAAELLGLLDLEAVTALAFLDPDPQVRAKPFLGQAVQAPEALAAMDFDYLFITPARWQAHYDQALALGVAREKILAWHSGRFGLLRRFGKPGVLPASLPETIIAELDSKEWYHRVELFPGVTTPGPASLQAFLLDQAGPGAFAGKTVLDIGAWTGPYTFEAEKRGAEVVSFDIQDPERSGYNLLNKLKGSRARYVRDSVYNLARHFQKHFDIILFLGVFYHLKNPVWALENIHAALKDGGILLFEGAVLEYAHTLDPVWAERKDRMAPYLEVPLAYYTTGDCLGHFSNWYVPNVLCLREWLHSAGFATGEITLLPGGSRAFGVARKLPAAPLEHSS